jgi:HPt (histidine-containing phosphotransfer) domain-containing protein
MNDKTATAAPNIAALNVPAPNIFDFNALAARCLNNLNLVDRVLTKFTSQVDLDLADLEQAITAGNAPEVAKLAHRIKGMTASIEARAMCNSAARCERTALAAATDELPAILAALRSDRLELFAAIQQMQQKRQAALNN